MWNKVSLNLDETAFMIYSNKNKNIDDAIIIRDPTISHVQSTKFLGIIIDDELRFVDHIGLVCSSGMLRKLAGILPYDVLFVPINKLIADQNRCIKLIGRKLLQLMFQPCM